MIRGWVALYLCFWGWAWALLDGTGAAVGRTWRAHPDALSVVDRLRCWWSYQGGSTYQALATRSAYQCSPSFGDFFSASMQFSINLEKKVSHVVLICSAFNKYLAQRLHIIPYGASHQPDGHQFKGITKISVVSLLMILPGWECVPGTYPPLLMANFRPVS